MSISNENIPSFYPNKLYYLAKISLTILVFDKSAKSCAIRLLFFVKKDIINLKSIFLGVVYE